MIGATGEPAQDVMAHEPAEAGGAGVTEGVQLKQAAVAGGYVLLVLADGALKLLAQEPEEEGKSHFQTAIAPLASYPRFCYCKSSASTVQKLIDAVNHKAVVVALCTVFDY
eukprot:5356-Heterococcus_DN1.PRE.2